MGRDTHPEWLNNGSESEVKPMTLAPPGKGCVRVKMLS